jgi:predicted Fe-Mo cluster-binding NifX family protein
MKHIIAIPLEGEFLATHFGHCHQFSFIDVENNVITDETMVVPPPHEPGLLPQWLAERGVTDIIAGGMGQRAINLCVAQKIRVNIGVQPKSPKELVNDWINKTLVTGTNACDH